MKKDRRKNQRFRVKDGLFAVIGDSPKMGPIIDISKSGIAFNYKGTEMAPKNSCELSIMFDDRSNHISYGPLRFNTKIVTDIDVDSVTSDETRRCGLEFINLTYYQSSWLTDCINSFTKAKC